MGSSLQIGITAYEAMPGMVFLRVPNERGRWVLTDRCAAEVDCERCGAVAGEPCMAWGPRMGCGERSHRYHTGVHCRRKEAGKEWRRQHQNPVKPKLRVHADDLADSQREPPDIRDSEPAAYVPSVLIYPKGLRWATMEETASMLDRSLLEIETLRKAGELLCKKLDRAPDGSRAGHAGVPMWWVCVDSITSFHARLR